ncbi:unnamed protein product [Moneuplotes crassus]|uniref:Uncharacterized protein n=1 Tax=Euplotes crassus TaxID=5936 RepID=A0AAD2D826_EUPCR|nr:unnamed protein product [Moneuplotes crassus]
MNEYEEAKQEIRNETVTYVFKRLADKETGLITRDALKYALFSYSTEQSKLDHNDEKLLDEMMQFIQAPAKAMRAKQLREEDKEDEHNDEEDSEGESEESEEEVDGIDLEHFTKIFNNFKFKLNADGNII